MGVFHSHLRITENQTKYIESIVKYLPPVCTIPAKVLEYYRKNIIYFDKIIRTQKQDPNKVYYYFMCLDKTSDNNYVFNIEKYNNYKSHALDKSLKYNFASNVSMEELYGSNIYEVEYIPSKPIPIPLSIQNKYKTK